MISSYAATKNGHMLLHAALGFEDGQRVPVEQFNYDRLDEKHDEEQREIGRNEAWMDHMRVQRMGFDLIMEDENVRLAVECYRYAAGLSATSEVELAARYGVTKQAVSKRAKQFQELLKLPPAAAMRRRARFLRKR